MLRGVLGERGCVVTVAACDRGVRRYRMHRRDGVLRALRDAGYDAAACTVLRCAGMQTFVATPVFLVLGARVMCACGAPHAVQRRWSTSC
jgi:hypothetical protein